MIPGLGQQLGDVEIDEQQMKRVEAIVLSMTPRERSLPHSIDGKRRLRIANGSGTSVEQVNQLLEARKQMEKMMKQMGKGKLPGLPTQTGDALAAPPMARRSGTKKKKKNKRKAGRR
jgi:signal recognition particle subunit SRP54